MVFFTCSLLGALSNLCIYLLANDLASLLLLSSTPTLASEPLSKDYLWGGHAKQHNSLKRSWRMANQSQAGYSHERNCFKTEYREEYIPGTEDSPGYVKSWKDTLEVPCKGSVSHSGTYRRHVRMRRRPASELPAKPSPHCIRAARV